MPRPTAAGKTSRATSSTTSAAAATDTARTARSSGMRSCAAMGCVASATVARKALVISGEVWSSVDGMDCNSTAESRSLASDLLSAVELQSMPSTEDQTSPEMTSAFLATVAEATQPIAAQDLIPLDRAVRAVSVAAAALVVLLVALLVFPAAVGRGMRTLFHTPTLFEGAQAVRDPLVGDVRVTYDFPAYTGLSRQIIEGSTGDLHALRGTHVQIEMRPLRSARQARLLLGDSGEVGALSANLNPGKPTATNPNS